MKKILHFTKNFNIPDKLNILILNGQIREFYGAEFSKVIWEGGKYLEMETFYITKEFNLLKISKYDRKKLDIKANYRIQSSYLSSMLMFDSYIKLNFIEKFIIDYSKEESIFHKMNFNQKLISFISFTTIPFFIVFGWNYFMNNDSNPDQNQYPKPDLNTKNQEIIIDNKKADTVSTKTNEFDLRSDSIITD